MLAETNTLLNVFEKDVDPDSVTLVCILANVSYGISCSLCSITINGHDVTMSTKFTTGNISLNGVNLPSQAITLTNLRCGTTYNYCLTAVYTSNMTEVGELLCGNFTTMNVTGNGTMCTYTYILYL